VNARVVGGAASAAVADAVAGPARPATVAGAFDRGTYLLLPDDQVVALLMPGAARLPNAVVMAATTGRWREGDPGWVGEHSVRTPGLEVRVVRWWLPRQVRRAPSLWVAETGATALVSSLSLNGHWPVPSAVRRATGQLGNVAAAGNLLGVRAAAAGLVGLGPGLTPAGDDVLAGFLLGLRALDEVSNSAAHLARAAGAGARAARARTTALAATLVRHAAAGEAADVAADLIDALAERAPLDRPLRALLDTGHTSGRDLAEGVLLAWRATVSLARREDRGRR